MRISELLAVCLLPPLAFAQRAFERAEVHASAPGTRESGGFLPVGRYECRGKTMLQLVASAYDIPTDAIAGGPDWLNTGKFDITAKAPAGESSALMLQQMLRALLVDRFGLAVHEESRQMPVYVMTLGRRGSRLRVSASAGPPRCLPVDGSPGLNHRECTALTMADLAKVLPQIAGNYVDRPVVDSTGLAGRYDFPLDWIGKAGYLAAKADPDRPAPVSIFDALEKLGLKMNPATHPVPAIVVDRVNRAPSEDSHASPTEFDAAVIQASKAGTIPSLAARNGRLEIFGCTLRRLMTIAFDASAETITGGPKWLDTDRFDVIAKSAEVMSPHTMSRMLKALIVERFKLATHSETQPVPVFALTLGKRSPKLQPADGAARSECRSSVVEEGITYVCRNTTMAQLAERLPDIAGAYLVHPMVDLTGLPDGYDFTLTWTPKARLSDAAAGRMSTGNDLTVFDAVDRQLGMKLEEQKYVMPVTVIDHVERTSVEQL